MTKLPRPEWLEPLATDPPPLAQAMDGLRAAMAGLEAPSHVCERCFGEVFAKRFVAAAREVAAGGAPAPETFGQMYFEHPACSGGIDVVKLMMPRGIETMLLGTQPPGFHGYPDVLETAFLAGVWFWPEKMRVALRAVAARLFWDWFGSGHYGLDGWPVEGREDDMLGPGDDILGLCLAALIDPADLVAKLSGAGTVWADEALVLGIYGFCGAVPSYVAADTGAEQRRYLEATEAVFGCLRAREARAVLDVVTPGWLSDAFFRYEKSHPKLAAEVSELENHYQVRTVAAVEAAQRRIDMDWPALPEI